MRHRKHTLAIALIGLLAACAAPESTVTPSFAPEQSAEATEPPGEPIPSEGPRQTCAGGDFCSGALPAGEWTTDAVGDTTLTLTVDQEWQAEELPEADLIALFPTDDSRSDIAAFRFTGEVFPNPCDIETTEQIEATPDAMMAWLAAHPELEVGEPEETTLGDGAGLRVEITAAKDELCPAGQGPPPDWILLWVLPAVRDFHFNDGQRAIVYALTVGDELVIVLAESVDDPDAFLPIAQPVVDSVRFTAD